MPKNDFTLLNEKIQNESAHYIYNTYILYNPRCVENQTNYNFNQIYDLFNN